MATCGSGNILATQSGGTYSITQASVASNLPPTEHLKALGVNVKDRKSIQFGIGPVTISGFVDTTNFGIGLEATLFGISLGTFYGNLKDGLGININVIAAKGSIKVYLDGTAVMLHLILTPIWGNGIDVTQKLIDIGKDASEA